MLYLLIKKRGNGKLKRETIHLTKKKARIKGILILRKMLQHQKKKIVTMRKLKLKMRETKQKMRRSHLIRKHHLKRLAQGPKTLKNLVKSPLKEFLSPLHPQPKSKKLNMKSLLKRKARDS
ncbi:unnamed protein product [Brassica rapa]|uniref:Uncharacterized protein n=1 Tax=Brassica campestris TaxID=3711 RepID=A0A8D9HBX5_BRACM|nr:unnamed protein product [Brassica rapa]